MVSSRTTAAGNERFFAITGYALSTPIFQRVQFELSESSSSSSTSGEESNSDDEQASRPVKRRRFNSSGRASNMDQLKTSVSFYEVADKFPPPQWRETEEKEEKELKEGKKKNSHQVDLVNQYKRRVAACKSFWGLSQVDELDLERLIELTADPSLALDSLKGGVVDAAAWCQPFLCERISSDCDASPADAVAISVSASDSSDSDSDSDSGSFQDVIVLYYTVLNYTILYYTILYYTILYYTILYYTILYYTILYYTILYYTIL